MDLRLLLFLALLLLVFHFLPFSTSRCPRDFDCGNLGNINFPFFNSSHPTDCGLCMINCDDKSSPKVALGIPQDKWFEAETIDISNFIMRIHDPVLQQHLDNRSCESFNFDLSFSKSPFISYTILQNITLFKCKFSLIAETRKKISDLFSGYDNYDLCNNLGYTIYYQNPKYHVPGPAVPFYETSQLQCTTLNLPMVSKYNDSVKPGFFELLTAEFDLQWNLSDDCNRSNCYSEGHICRTNWLEDSRCAKAEKGKKNLKVILATATSIGGFVILVTIAFCFWRRFPFMEIWMKPKKFQNIEAFLKNYGSIAPKRYYYSEVKKMTNSFKIKLGQGGYGCVYKGNLQDGSSIAVKVLKESKGSGEEFINEVASISRTSHVNIVTLIGFCFEGHKRALLYEFMPNGSLEKFTCGGNGISSSTDHQLGWQRKYKIAVGIARGLEYLHRGCNTRIVHFDIKPHNILLDEDFCPKISDFGLAKLCPSKQSTMSILGARGTVGYIAPEVFCKAFGGVSYKSDVYSYGMMVFEMVGVRRRNVNAGVDHSSEMYFPDWIYKRLDQVDDDLSVDGLIMDEEEEVLRRKMIIVSLWCIQTHPSSRPSMTKVVEMLEGSLEALQIPSNPCVFPPQEPPKDSSIVDLTWHSDSNNVALVVS